MRRHAWDVGHPIAFLLGILLHFAGGLHIPQVSNNHHSSTQHVAPRLLLTPGNQNRPTAGSEAPGGDVQVPGAKKGFRFHARRDIHHFDIECGPRGDLTREQLASTCRHRARCYAFSLYRHRFDQVDMYCLKFASSPLSRVQGNGSRMVLPHHGVYVRQDDVSPNPPVFPVRRGNLCKWLKWGGVCYAEKHQCICAEIDDDTHKVFYRAAYFCEFGYELVLFTPWVYYLHSLGLLRETVGPLGSDVLNFFSPRHTQLPLIERTFCFGPPSHRRLHEPNFQFDYQWSAPNFTDQYGSPRFSAVLSRAPPVAVTLKDTEATFPDLGDPTKHRPLIIIHNKYAEEWQGAPTNFLDLSTLDSLFAMLEDRYQVVYINQVLVTRIGSKLARPAQEPRRFFLNDTVVLARHPQVLTINNLYHRYAHVLSYNRLLFALHARCRHFISVQGGNSIMASYFGGTNIVYFKKGRDLNDFEAIYPQLANTKIVVARSFDMLFRLVETHYLNGTSEKPLTGQAAGA